MLAAAILTLILGAILSLHLQGLRIYQSVAATDRADFDAATAIEQLEESIESCFRVTGRYVDRITISTPLAAWDTQASAYVPVQPLTEGDWVRYYLSDASGRLGASGNCLWRAVRRYGTSTFVSDAHPMVAGVTTLQFTYTMMAAPRNASAAVVELAARAQSKEAGTTVLRTHRARIALRNASYGPVTDETGVDEP